MAINPREVRTNKAIALSKSLGQDYSINSGFDELSLGQFASSSSDANILSSNNVSVLSNEFDAGNRTVDSSRNNGRQQSSLLDQKTPGTGALNDPTAKFSRDRNNNNSSNPTSTTTSSNSATASPGILDLYLGNAGSNQSALSIDEFLTTLYGNAPEDAERVPPGTPNVASNQLSAYASYNCILSLGVLAPASISDPKNTYRKRGADFTILKSGGGGINDRRVTNAFDDNSSGNLEFFIDNFNMNSILSPNNKTGMAVGTSLSFQVFEPYSLGIFLQNLKIAAREAGYVNYLDAPYLLEIDFIGWDTNGRGSAVSKSARKIPFKLSNIQFDVEQGGSTYEVTGFPWNQQSLSDVTQQIKDPVSIKGSTVANALSFGEQSLTAVINAKARELAEADGKTASDLYVIRFPKSRTTVGASGSTSTEATGATENLDSPPSNNVVRTDQFVNRVDGFFSSNSVSSNNNIYQKLTGSETTDVNKIGQSSMTKSFNDGTNHPFPLGLNTYDREGDIYRRDGIELTLEDNERVFQFPQGMTIQKIIEEMVLISNYAGSALDQVDKEGMITWFVVEPECHILDVPSVAEATGFNPKIFVYNVVPYRVHASAMVSPNNGVPGANNLALQVSKEYDYIYSGNNQDVLGFDIRFNTAFFEALRADYGNFSGTNVAGAKDTAVEQGSPPYQGQESKPGDLFDIVFGNRLVNNVGDYTGGADNSDPKRNLAKQFHNILLNSNADLIVADIEIWGDPYYLPDSGMGNYTSSNSGQTATMNADGSIDYQRNEVDILVNFRTPVDYNARGGMEFQGDTTRVNGFSGFYKVINVENVISGNRFTQTLQLVRRKNQTTDGISTSRTVTENQNTSPNQNATPPAEQSGQG